MKKILLFFALFTLSYVVAQDGKPDLSYSPTCPFDYVYASTLDGSGNLFVAGSNTTNGIVMDIIKIRPNGTIDTSFNVTYFDNYSNVNGNYTTINALCLQSDGKLLVGGAIDNVFPNTISIIRLSTTGVLDSAFTDSLPTGFAISDIIIQPVTNKIMVGGYGSTGYGGGYLYRLLSTGTIDTTFNSGNTGPDWRVYDILPLSNGDMYICGDFSNYNGSAREHFAKLTSTGSLYSLTFTPLAGGPNRMALDSSNRIVAIGSWYDTSYSNKVIRFTTTGTVDNTFTPPAEPAPIYLYEFYDLEVMSDNKVVVSGAFQTVGGVNRKSIARFNTNGSLDLCFDPGTGPNGGIFDMVMGANETIYATGYFTNYNGVSRPSVARVIGKTVINANDNSALAQVGVASQAIANVLGNDVINNSAATLSNVVLTQVSTTNSGVTLNPANGSVNVSATTPAGTYTVTYSICEQGTQCYCDTAVATITVLNLVEANDDEAVVAFSSGPQVVANILANDTYGTGSATPSNVTVSFQAPLPTGLQYNALAGNFTATNLPMGQYEISYQICGNGSPSSCATALLFLYITTDNSGFSPTDVRANREVFASGIQPTTNKIIIGGDFTSYQGVSINKIARLNHEDLTLDTSFNTHGTDAATDIIQDLICYPDGRILVVGKFASFNSISHGRGIAMLRPDGSVVTGDFNIGGPGAAVGVPVTQTIYSVAKQSSDYLIIVGDFQGYNGNLSPTIARLTPTGGFDPTFVAGSGFNGIPYSVAVLPDNTILVGGSFTTYKGQSAPGIVRLDSSGNIVSGFTAGAGIGPAGSYVDEVFVVGTDVYIGGSFNTYNGATRRNIAKLSMTGALNTAFNPGTGFSHPVRAFAFQSTPEMFTDEIGFTNLYVGGDFVAYNGTPINYLACLNPVTGTINPNFYTGSGPDNTVFTLTLEQNLKLILGGRFINYNGTQAQRVTRIFPGYLGTGQFQGRMGLFEEQEKSIAKGITIYPNPGSGIFNIDFKGYDEQSFEVNVHNALGQTVYRGTISAGIAAQIDLTQYEAGNYFITLHNNSETINKIVVKK